MATGNPIGLDVGSTSVRAVETSRGKDGAVITAFGRVPLPDGAVQGGVIHDEKAVTLALKELWSTTKFRGRTVTLGVTNPQIVVREMSVANVGERDLRQSLPFQVRDSLPLPVERSLLDFCPLEDASGRDTVRGLLIAAPKEAVVTAVSAVERAALHVGRVDLASFALLRAASRLDSQVEAIVDIGAQATSVVVHDDGQPLIVRTIPRGGAEITAILADRLDLTPADAEERKCRVGLRDDEDPVAAEVIRSALGPIISEIRSSFAYLNAGGRQARVTRLSLSGGGSLLPGLGDALRDHLGVDVVAADPASRLRRSHRATSDPLGPFSSSAAVSIGLALGAPS
ncbi:type IV pilus assembly protein PilM [Planosporangium thailandense]|uniref:Type IV pilus assembly protein PilM n=1 Tax=Planosporangium thailandense TaxID=765197 RepID=A0ABX0Y7T9_9ACTN|nr:type IV pilus assembly protein PilM [Planosporangium thailandense]NJC74197.1 type IV pilus assembly protein PilM [Planosporangium thailandense]